MKAIDRQMFYIALPLNNHEPFSVALVLIKVGNNFSFLSHKGSRKKKLTKVSLPNKCETFRVKIYGSFFNLILKDSCCIKYYGCTLSELDNYL